MNSQLTIIAAASLAFGGCAGTHVTHTAPGTPVELALAKKAELVKTPAPAPAPAAHTASANVPAVEPPMPEKDALREKVADAYSRGVFCLQAEKDADAIQAFEEAVKLDPTFSDAWENLAMLYEKTGDTKKALDAFKKAKKLARQ
ncbi:MAG TPA: tetratricopeptide repeat protein [Chthoniobacteraceae bacterium]|nr:tetratricopeptide repeat protein [Chthoniobacteraceae bacterium]